MAAALMWLAGCSFLIDPDAEPTRCSQPPGAANPCDPPLVCARGFCLEASAPPDAGSRSRAFGDRCTADEQCDTGVCVPASALGLGSGTGFCATACCSDADCDPTGGICFSSGTGAKVCVPPALLGITAGTARGGAACVRGSDCKSGVCDPSMACLINCSRNGDCPASHPTCKGITVTESPTRFQLACTAGTAADAGVRPDTGVAGATCTAGADCRAGSCRSYMAASFCAPACGTDRDCLSTRAYCGVRGGTGTSGRNTVAYCAPHGDSTSPTGASCTINADCDNQRCIEGTCAGACCRDTDCGPSLCKPVGSSSSFRMVCVP